MTQRIWFIPLLLLAGLVSVPTEVLATSDFSERSRQHADDQWAENVLDTLSLSEKVAQLLVVQEPLHGSRHESVKQAVLRGIGGVRTCQRKPLLQADYLNELQYAARLPLLVTQNTSCHKPLGSSTRPFPISALAASQQRELVRAYAQMTGHRARLAGVHQIYGPIRDPEGPLSPADYAADAPPNVREANWLLGAYAEGVRASGLLSTPGYLPDDLASMRDSPFQLAAAGSEESSASAAIPSAVGKSVHNITVTWPNALERPSNILDPIAESTRGAGLITVDLSVTGRSFSSSELKEVAVEAIQSGADQIVIRPQDLTIQRVLVQAIREGLLAEERITRSTRQLLHLKQDKRLHHQRDVDLNAVAERTDSEQWTTMNREVARRSLTLLSNHEDVLPLSPVRGHEILHVTLSEDRNKENGRNFRRHLRTQNVSGDVIHRILDRKSDAPTHEEVVLGVPHYDIVVVSIFLEGQLSSQQRQLIEELSTFEVPVVLANFGPPTLMADLEGPQASLLAWTPAESTQEVAAQALFGRSSVTGRLPTSVSARYPAGTGHQLTQQSLRTGDPEEAGMTRPPLARIDQRLYRAVADSAFPGAALAIGRSGVLTKLQGYGYETYESSQPVTPRSLFDLASLTKVVATTTAAMTLYESGDLDLTAPVSRYWSEFGQHDKKDTITIRHLLTHTSGLRPFYHPFTLIHGTPFFRLTRPFTPFFRMEIQSKEEMFNFIARDSLQYEPGQRYRYSDLNMITLAHVIERITGQPLNDYLQEEIFQPLGMNRTGFRSTGPAAIAPESIPTEFDRTFRARLVRGEVHDETAYIMGGTAGHAGLFSTARDLALFADMLVRGGTVNGRQFLEEETIELFTRPVQPERHTRALGWDTKSTSGYSSAGELLGPNSYGHTGFTGTSFWIDPDQDLFVILLTNRVHPTRANRKHIPLRPEIADLAYRSIRGPADILFTELLGLP